MQYTQVHNPYPPLDEIFIDKSVNAAFVERGYHILKLDNSGFLEELASIFISVNSKYQSGFMSTMLLADPEHKKNIHVLVSRALEPTIKQYFSSYRQLCCGFAVKKANEPKSAMPLHQDISFIRPGARPALSFWLPLVPTDENNGCLQVVPGSHLHYRQPRAPGSPFPLKDQEAELREQYLISLPTKYGEAIVIDQALFHSSPPNRSGIVRPVATSVLLPREAQTFYYFRNAESAPVMLEAYAVQDEFYFGHRLGARPEQADLYEQIQELAQDADLGRLPRRNS